MARALRIQYPGAFYHVTCRGNERKEIFLDIQDHQLFLEKLRRSLDIYNVSLLAYVCMPNHFHLLLSTPEGNLSEFMRHFNISYTFAFNMRHRRVGHLYQGRYKAFLIEADSYLIEVSRYIHLNPIRAKIASVKTISERWDLLLTHEGSSLPGYLFLRKRGDLVNYEALLSYLGRDNRQGRQGYREFIQFGLKHDIENPLERGKGSGIIGGVDFIKSIKDELLDEEAPRRELPALRELRKRFQPEELIDRFSRLVLKDKEEICKRGKQSVERLMLMELLYRFCQVSQPVIGNLMGGVDYSAISRARRRLQIRLEREKELKRRFNELSNQLLEMSRVKI
jgi:REP element-mobilizing transposase RayT